MSSIRSYLRATLQRVITGGDITTDELDKAIADPLSLDRDEREAWEELSHWADDADIRAREPNYAVFKREWMRKRLDALVE